MIETTALQRLALALGIGLLAGLERGWSQRSHADGGRVAGLRTFGLIGLFGGTLGLLAGEGAGWLLAAGLVAVAVLLGYGYAAASSGRNGLSATTAAAGLVVYSLGALAARGFEKEAAAAGVIATALLGFKPTLHAWIKRFNRTEVEALLTFSVISVAVLPNLPDKGFGPWDSLNPYHIWWMVVLIAGISFAGYAAVRLLGPKGGLAATSLLGGFVSSTAVTLSLSRLDLRKPSGWRLHAAGIVFASSVMFPRVLVEVGAVNAALLPMLAPSVGAAAGVGLLGALLLMRGDRGEHRTEAADLRNPLGLRAALFFGALLAGVTLASVGLKRAFGDAGVYATALTAGLADVDAISLSLARQARQGLDPGVAVNGILIALAVNTVAKAGLAAVIAQRRLGASSAGVLAAALAVGGLVLALTRA